MDRIAAIVLAAGLSRRMGEPKQLLPWGEHTIIEQIVATLRRSPVDDIVVVVGHRAAEVQAKVRQAAERPVGPSVAAGQAAVDARVRTVFNPAYADGMLSSIQCGVAALAADVRAAFIVLCDQPQLKAETLFTLREAFERAGLGLAVPSHQMRRGHPLLVDVHKYRAEIAAIDGPSGLQTLLQNHPGDILHVEFDDPGVLMDMDTRTDYEQAVDNVRARDQRE